MRTKIIASIGTVFVLSGCAIKPVVLSTETLRETIRSDMERLSQHRDQITAPISLDEAIARSVRNNRDRKLKVLETALTRQQIDLARHDLLPSLTTSAGYSGRNNYAATASVRFADGVPEPLPADPAYSVSQDKQRTTYDVGFTWNVLDFGLSYVRANQQAHVVLPSPKPRLGLVVEVDGGVRQYHGPHAGSGAVAARRVEQRQLPGGMAQAADDLFRAPGREAPR